MISGPLIENTLRARLAFRTFEEDGYLFNTFNDQDEAQTDDQAIRLTVDWQATDDLSFVWKAEQNEFDTKGRAIEITLDENLTPGGASFNDILVGGLSQPGFDSDFDFVRQTNTPEFSNNEIRNFTFTGNYTFYDHDLTFTTGFLDFEYDELCDCDFIAIEAIPLELNEDYSQFSQEVRFASPEGRTVTWIAGLFYQEYEQDFSDIFVFQEGNLIPTLDPGLAPLAGSGIDRQFSQESDSWALFGQFTWNISDAWRATFGARYTEEEKTASKILRLTDSSGASLSDPLVAATWFGALNVESDVLGHDITGSRDESAFIPQASVQWDVNSNHMLYAQISNGFKAGGFDPRSNIVGATPNTPDDQVANIDPNLFFEFENEDVTALEIGSKSTLADGRGELNVTLFYMDFEDLQISQFDGGVGFNVGNADAETMGIEIDGRWLFNEYWSASYGAAYLDFEYTDYQNGNCFAGEVPDGIDVDGDGNLDTCDYTGRRGVYTPEFTFNFSVDFTHPIGGGIDLVSFLDTQYIDEQQVHVNQDPNGVIDSYLTVGGRIGLEANYWSVALVGKNLLDEDIISYSANVPLSDSIFGTNTQYSFVRRPRTIALEGKIKF